MVKLNKKYRFIVAVLMLSGINHSAHAGCDAGWDRCDETSDVLEEPPKPPEQPAQPVETLLPSGCDGGWDRCNETTSTLITPPPAPVTPQAFDEENVSDGFHRIHSLALGTRTLACTDCLDWKLIGECNWLKCAGIYCSLQVSPKVSHYIPDLIVTTHSSQFPISDMNEIFPFLKTTPGSMTRTLGKEDYLTYKHATVFGNPGLLGYKALNAAGGWMCESVIKAPWVPLYQSESDPYWGDHGIESLYPQSLLGLPKIDGAIPLLTYWASVYPRCGWVVHPYDAITGAVMAHRAADIVYGPPSIHVAVPAGNDCGDKCWAPGSIEANKIKNHKFQSLFPIYEKSAKPFGGDAADWASAKIGSRPGRNKFNEQAYVYALWRPYKCCEKKGKYLGSLDW